MKGVILPDDESEFHLHLKDQLRGAIWNLLLTSTEEGKKGLREKGLFDILDDQAENLSKLGIFIQQLFELDPGGAEQTILEIINRCGSNVSLLFQDAAREYIRLNKEGQG